MNIIYLLSEPIKWLYVKYNKYRYPQFLKDTFLTIGDNLIIDIKTSSFSKSTINTGNNVYIGAGAWIHADLDIGNNVMFGPRCTIIGGDHLFGVKGKSNRFLQPLNRNSAKKIIIEDEVWCGANVIINKGVIIGMGAVIGSGSVVVKSIPPYTVAVGNPAIVKKKIFEDHELIEHLKLIGYKNDIAQNIVLRRTQMIR